MVVLPTATPVLFGGLPAPHRVAQPSRADRRVSSYESATAFLDDPARGDGWAPSQRFLLVGNRLREPRAHTLGVGAQIGDISIQSGRLIFRAAIGTGCDAAVEVLQRRIGILHPQFEFRQAEIALKRADLKVSGVRELVRAEMCGAYALEPPLAVDIGLGENWAEAKS